MARDGLLLLGLAVVAGFSSGLAASERVRVTEGEWVLPTYTLEEREPAPPFFSRGLYPYSSYRLSSRSKVPRPVSYHAIFLENEYLKLTFVPELGGRIWAAYDKMHGREFFYRTAAVKPAPYNLRSTWPAGNLELYGPYDTHMITWPGERWVAAHEQHPDGSATVILSHVDHIFRDKIWLYVTLEPGQARIRLDIRLYNPGPLEHRYLLWTNAAAPVNENTQFFYPMTRTIGHVVASLGTWPVMSGVDYSWFKNHPGMLGLFGLDLFDNYIGTYDHKARYGVLRWADRYEARGAKMWTWGTGQNAAREAATYADPGDGEYMELQSGRFLGDSEYHFLDPQTEDGWSEYWYPVYDLDGVSTATPSLVAHLARNPQSTRIELMATEAFPSATVTLDAGSRQIYSQTASLAPGATLRFDVPGATSGEDLLLQVVSSRGGAVLSFKDFADGSHPEARLATENLPKQWPKDPTAEQAVLQGEFEELAGHDARARELYEAALKKDPGFVRALLALGRMDLREGLSSKALELYQRAVERDPWSGEARYGLGLALAAQGQHRLARAEFAHISPNSSRFAVRDAALGREDLALADFSRAEEELRRATERNPRDLATWAMLAASLRRQMKLDRAAEAVAQLEKLDPTSTPAAAERYLAARARKEGADDLASRFDELCASHPQQYLELATFYSQVESWLDVAEILRAGVSALERQKRPLDAMMLYWLAFAETRTASAGRARETLGKVANADRQPEIFPFRVESLRVLEEIASLNPKDDLAWSLRGDLLASLGRRAEAVAAWKKGVELNANDRAGQRLLGLAYDEWLGQAADARPHLQRAVELGAEDADTFVSLAEAQAEAGSLDEALATVRVALTKFANQDALRATMARLLVLHEEPEAALALLQSKAFFVAESSMEFINLYRETKLNQGVLFLRKGQTTSGIQALLDAAKLPATIPASDFEPAVVPKLAYYTGLAYWLRGDADAAQKSWQKLAELGAAQGEDAYFRARALERLGRKQEAAALYDSLATTLARDTDARHVRARAFYERGLGLAGKGQGEQAKAAFERALGLDSTLLGAKRQLLELEVPRRGLGLK